MKWSFAWVAVAALASVSAAQTFIVDAANGPGTNFTSIVTATATVPDGSVLIVRGGSYAAFAIANKGLTILCDSGVTVGGNTTITGTSAVQTVELRGMTINGDLSLNGCLGLALLYQCNIGFSSSYGTLRATACMQVHADGCSIGTTGQGQSALVLVSSRAALRNCFMVTALASACDVQFSSLQLTDCGVGVGFTGSSAIQLTNADVRIIGGSIGTGVLAPWINGSGVARVDPSVTGNSNYPSFGPSVLGTVVSMPAVATTGGALGSTLTVSMRGSGGDVGALIAGMPGVPYFVPGIRDAIWLRAGTETVCFFTTFAVPVQVTTNVPNSAALRGLRVAWQGITYRATAGLQSSTPAITAHW